MGTTWSNAMPVPREFDCKLCGNRVVVTERADRRTVFCCAQHEREFWRHRDRYERRKDTSRGHVTYLSREDWENRKEAGL